MSDSMSKMKAEFEQDLKDAVIESIKTSGVEVRNKEDRGNGGSTHYYTLPEGATELRHLIRHKKMQHGIGEAFCALYRLDDNGERERNLRKALFYIQCELEYMENHS